MIFFKKIFGSFSRHELVFLTLMMIMGFCISCEYGIVRSASQSIFLQFFSSEVLPYAWLILVPVNFLIISLYNRGISRYGCLKVLLFIVIFSIAFNIFCAFEIMRSPALSFIQFLWKDIYILLMFKQLWSLIHSSVDPKKAKLIYGLIFACGGMGSIVGGFFTHFYAKTLGSSSLFLVTLLFYSIIGIIYYHAIRLSPHKSNTGFITHLKEDSPNMKEGFSIIKKSKYLLIILFLVVFMQMSVSLIDYQFNTMLSKTIIDTDLRTQFMGKTIGIINSATTLFQLIGGYVFLHFFGVKKCHLLIPLFLGINAFFLNLFPMFSIATYTYVAIKTVDFSLFSISREMLYIPLSLKEKYKAKAIIDVFIYRSSKALGSFFLIFLQLFATVDIFSLVSKISIALFSFWAIFVYYAFKKKEVASLLSFEKN